MENSKKTQLLKLKKILQKAWDNQELQDVVNILKSLNDHPDFEVCGHEKLGFWIRCRTSSKDILEVSPPNTESKTWTNQKNWPGTKN